MDGSDSVTACDHCEVQHDSADIYDVDGQELCEKCKRDLLLEAQRQAL